MGLALIAADVGGMDHRLQRYQLTRLDHHQERLGFFHAGFLAGARTAYSAAA
jgi:hypothetical protein